MFWPAYTGSVLTTLFGPAFEPIKRRTREFGLAFASAHLVHLALVAWLIRPTSRDVCRFWSSGRVDLPSCAVLDRSFATNAGILELVGFACGRAQLHRQCLCARFFEISAIWQFRVFGKSPTFCRSVFRPLLRLAAFMQRAASHGAR
jgi:hypothetical protein